WWEFMLGMEGLKSYLVRHHPEEFDAILQEACTEDATEYEFIHACIECYRAHFDPSRLKAEVERLEAEHTAMMERWADLPTAISKEKARERFAELEARIGQLRRQQEDLAELVETHYHEMLDLETAIGDAK